MIEVKIHMAAGARIPEYQSGGASGADICALLDEAVTLKPGDTALIPTGISIEIPEGYEAQIRPRSGLAVNHGITLLNTPGTIDSDYRGEIKVIVTNLGKKDFTITSGMRIAQMVFSRSYRGRFIVTDELAETKRNNGGFGHTGT
ncbi:MAG: deoxyuridine 5'-triphosphate nucleotidohydrolase [Spirochaetes bacterium RBG_16_49_21]|nr:MAG: deoxyuridine 5'-triphosphate nucleotidohydrolase [Spirochaetes bacterium RBG_16_49_21]